MLCTIKLRAQTNELLIWFAVQFAFIMLYLLPQMQCLSRKKDEEFSHSSSFSCR